MPIMKVAEELCRILHVAARVQHLLYGGKILPVKVVIDLHTTDIDELGSLPPGRREGFQNLRF